MQLIYKIFKKPITSTIISIIAGFIVATIILAISGFDAGNAMVVLFNGMFSKPKYIADIIIKSTPIILTGISVAFAFKTGLFNMGAEGQYMAGATVSTIVGISLNLPPILQIPIVILSGMIAGAIIGGLIGYLKAKFGIHEVITSIMFNWIAFYFSNFISNGLQSPFHKPETSGTYPINKSGFTMFMYDWKTSKEGISTLRSNRFLGEIFRADLNYGIIIAILVAIIISFILYRSTKGYELRAVGFNPHASEFSGINVSKNIIQVMLISGAISGLAAALTITGTSPHCLSNLAVFENNGFNGLSVALIAGSSPIGCIFSGLFFSSIIYGGRSIQSKLGAPSEIINIMIGTIVFFVALTNIVPKLVNKLKKRGVKNA